MEDTRALLVLLQCEAGKWLVCSPQFGSTDALLLRSGSCFYVLGAVCSAKENHFVSQGGKNRGGRVGGRSDIVTA